MGASLSGVFSLQEFTDLGLLGAGMRLYTYAPSTTTQKVAYTDLAGTIPHTYTNDGLGGQYIALNSRGELPAPLFLLSGGYDIALKTVLGVTVWTRRAQSLADAAAPFVVSLGDSDALANGAGMLGFNDSLAYTVPFVGASLRARGAVVTDKPYLADSTGALSSTVGIQAAITTGRDVHLVPGTFDCTTTALNFTTAGQTIYLHGATLRINQLNVNADNVSFVGPGTIQGPLRVGQLAAPAAVGQKQLQLVDASELKVGDAIWSSYGDNVSNFPMATPNVITAIVGNTVTVTSNLVGTVGLPTGIYVGTFSFTALVGDNASKNLRFINLKMTRTQGYFLYTWRWNQGDFLTNIPSTYCYGVDFDQAGLDQFCVVRAKKVFVDCTFGISYDVAKQGFVYGDDAQILGLRCSMARGNYDMDFLPISDAGRNTYFQGTNGKIAFTDSSFDGTNKLPASAYFFENSLHCLNWNSGGAPHDGSGGSPSAAHFVEFSFSRCKFSNYTRSLFSTTVVADAYSSVVDRASFEDCQIGTQLFQLKAVSGKTLTIKAFNFSKCAIFSSSAAYELTLVQGALFSCNILQSYIKATGAIPELVSSRLVDSTIDNSGGFWLSSSSECLDVLLTGGTRVGPRFTYAAFPVRGSFIVDSATFAASPGDVSASLLLGADATSIYGQSSGVSVRSVNGSLTYNCARVSSATLVWARLTQTGGTGGRFKGLIGDDWAVGIGAQIAGYGGAVVKSTYAASTTLAAGAAISATSIVVTSFGTAAIGDQVFVKLSDGTVLNSAIAAGWGGASTTIPLTDSLPAAATSGQGVSFLRVVTL